MVLRDLVRNGRPSCPGRAHPAGLRPDGIAAARGPDLRGRVPAVGDRRPVPGRRGRPPARGARSWSPATRSGPCWSRPWRCRACRSGPWWRCCSRPRCSRPRSSRRAAAITPDILQGEKLRPRRRGVPDDLPGGPGGRRGRRGTGGGLHRRARLARRGRGHVRDLRPAHRARHPGPAGRRQAGDRPAVAAGPHAGGLPAGLRRPGAAHPAAVRLAGGLLHGARGDRRAVRGQTRRRADRDRPGAGVYLPEPPRSPRRCSRASSARASGST